jgi:hypothetical protein
VVPLQTQVKLRAEANILSRANERLKAEKATDAERVSALQQEVRALHQQLTDAGSMADKLRAELGERDGVISDNYVSLQGLRRRVQELETHKVRDVGVCLGWLAGCVVSEALSTASDMLVRAGVGGACCMLACDACIGCTRLPQPCIQNQQVLARKSRALTNAFAAVCMTSRAVCAAAVCSDLQGALRCVSSCVGVLHFAVRHQETILLPQRQALESILLPHCLPCASHKAAGAKACLNCCIGYWMDC